MTTLRSRQQRRKSVERQSRTPSIWRGPFQPTETSERPVVQHGIRGRLGISWRLFSGLITVSFSFVLALFFMTDFFYVRTIQVGGAFYLDEGEIFRYADIAETHIFWVDPAKVRENILDASPVVADARVTVGWPPNMVRIVIQEREPALVWIQAGISAWVDLQGRVLRLPSEGELNSRPDLIRIIADDTIEGPPGGNVLVDSEAVAGALQLQTLLPERAELRYNPANGLGFRDAGGWDVWLGTGTNMRDKLLIYNTLIADLQGRAVVPTYLNIVNPDAPYWCCQPAS